MIRSFGTRKKAERPGEIIFADICGPFDESFGKYCYMAVFKDAFTKFCHLSLMKEKSEVKFALEDVITHARMHGH